MRVLLNMTTTINGMAAYDDDSTAVFQRGEWLMLVDLARETGALVWGRRTHEIVRRAYGVEALRAFDGLGRIVLTSDAEYPLEDGWAAATSPEGALAQLEAASHNSALIAGGGTTNASFIQAGLVDEIILFVESVLLGRGVQAFADREYEVRMDLVGAEKLDRDLVKLRYEVRKG